MDPKQQIERAVEHRRAQAAERNLTRKLTLIATALGLPIRRQGGSSNASGFGFEQQQILEADWAWQLEPEETNELPTDEEGSSLVGWQFDGLSSGLNMQVCYDKTSEVLKATYQGYVVYEERCHTLVRYLPSPQWEDRLDSLYQMAEKKAKLKELERADDDKEEGRKGLKKVLDYLRINWGV